MGKVSLRISPSLASASDPRWVGWFTFEKDLERGETVGTLLTSALAERKGLSSIVVDSVTSGLNEGIVVFLNDSLLELQDPTRLELGEGDAVMVLAMDIGG